MLQPLGESKPSIHISMVVAAPFEEVGRCSTKHVHSAMNKTFLTLYNQATIVDPQSLADPRWPMTLADAAAFTVTVL